MAWVQWHFAPGDVLDKRFNCDRCPASTREDRRCDDPGWDHSKVKRYPKVALLEDSGLFEFCPAKLFRDEPNFVRRCENLYAEWKAGRLPRDAATPDECDAQDFDLYVTIIQAWERQERMEGQRFLVALVNGVLSGGKQSSGGSNGRKG